MFGNFLRGRKKKIAAGAPSGFGGGSQKLTHEVLAQAPGKMDPHTLRVFGQMLDDLNAQAARLGEHVAQMVARCVPVFLDHDITAAKELIQSDLQADQQKEAIISRTLEVLARHQPVASDLRLVLAVEHVATDLERTADHAKNIAKRTLSLPAGKVIDPTMRELIIGLHSAVQGMLIDAMRAFSSGDTMLAADVRRRDQTPDKIYDDLFHASIARIQANPSEVAVDIQCLFVAKSLERIGDHATNIAEEASFRSRGDIPSATRRP